MKKEPGLPPVMLESLLALAFEASINGIMVLEALRDEQGRITDFGFGLLNETGLRMLKRTREELIGKSFKTLYPGVVVSGLFDEYVRVCETGEEYTNYTHASSTQDSWWALVAKAIPGGYGIMVTYLDITDRQKADTAALQQAQLLTDIMESGPLGLVVLRASLNAQQKEFRIERVNSLFQHQISQSKTDLVGQPLTAAFSNARESGLLSRCIMGVELGEAQEFELPYGCNGQRSWFRVSMVPKNDLLILTLTDITLTRKAQMASHSQAQLLSSILDGSQNGIVAFDAIRQADGRLINFRPILQNAVHRLRTKCTDDALQRMTLADFFTDEVISRLLPCCINVVETGQTYREDITHDYGDGPGYYTLSVAKRGDGIVLTIHDKTREKWAHDNLLANQQQLEAINLELRRTNDNLQSFTYIASHDLQEPLRKIQSFGDILISQRSADLGEDILYLERMQAAAKRMSLLIHDLLTYSRLSNRQEIHKEVALDQAVAGALGNLELSIAESGASFDVPDLPTVRGDAAQLQQLFQNLFSNAIKFRQAGTAPQVSVGVRHLSPDEAAPLLPAGSVRGYYRIDVRDNGIGFDPRYVDRIFQVFQRLHGKNQFAGTGIGLAICERIVTNHGGAITATSQPGQGATFMVYLPA